MDDLSVFGIVSTAIGWIFLRFKYENKKLKIYRANTGAIVLPLDEGISDDDLEKCVKMLFSQIMWLYNEQLKLLEEMTSSSPDSKCFKSS